ncbi:NnrS family protein [Kineobactrum sediminis]|uniref:NnrS family protein n=1 Tax=Kineobactrum sediminis TaxID=1905677 RepID=A0A2N5XXZ8_9GAMM|nr:NnrS family protein [Kineobactrum sediminis]PLW81024.1 NnrS family protein [Kineobactrum sediminis]
MPESPPSSRASARQLFAYPFRIFFFSLAVLAVLVVPLWVALITGRISLPLAMPGLYWHQHELIFAFLQAGIAGFLLTAVCVWTGTERLHGPWLLALWLVWLLGRVLMMGGAELPFWLVAGVNLAFLPLVMLDAGRRICTARQWRQLVILVVLGLLWLMQLGFLFRPTGPFVPGALVVAMTLMLVVGGRITPSFSLAWLRQQGRSPDRITTLPAVEKALLASMVLTLLAVLSRHSEAIAVAGVVAGIIVLLRLLLWQGWRVRQEPLLWILHLSLLWIPIALWLLAGSALGAWPRTVWTHAVGVGAIGGLMLGVISRVALGHTGRRLQLPRGMVTAFWLIQLAALLRVATGLELLPWNPGVTTSAVFWVLAFALFLLRYTYPLASPRVDGKPG